MTPAQSAQPQPDEGKTQPDAVTCEQVTSLLMEYVNQELDPARMQAFAEHICHCRDCVGFLNTYQQTVKATHALSYDELPPDLQTRTLEFLRQKI